MNSLVIEKTLIKNDNKAITAASDMLKQNFNISIYIKIAKKLQELCKSQTSWDEPLTGGTLQKWKNSTSDLMKSKPMKIERYYFTEYSQVRQYQPFEFCDASIVAYAASILLNLHR